MATTTNSTTTTTAQDASPDILALALKIVSRDENLVGLGQYPMDDMFKSASASATADCIKTSPQVSDLVHSPFTKRLGEIMFDFYDNNSVHAAPFARAMASVTTSKYRASTANPTGSATSSRGAASSAQSLTSAAAPATSRAPWRSASRTLSFRVQDSERILAEGRRILATEHAAVAGRIQLQEHNFFKPQPAAAESTDGPIAALFLRHIFHNWADADSITILRTLVPSLETAPAGTPILISDRVLRRHVPPGLHAAGLPPWTMPKPHSGRPCSITYSQEEELVEYMMSTKMTYLELSLRLFNNQFSKAIIKRALYRQGFYRRVARRKPPISEKDRQRPLAFA